MFLLQTLSDTLPLPPHTFAHRTRTILEDTINQRYANRVIPRVGLCISFHDLLHAPEHGLLDSGAGDGTVYVNATFRLLVFRPFRGEILHGRITRSSPAGVHLTLEFFDDVLVPPTHLFGNTALETAGEEGGPVWVWRHEMEEGVQEYFFDANMVVRWRVEEEVWRDVGPAGPRFEVEGGGGDTAEAGGEGEGEKRAPYALIGSMSQAGLGVVEWW